MGEGGRSSDKDDNDDNDGTAAYSTCPVEQGEEVSDEGDVVTAAHTGGKGRVTHPGGPPISCR